MSKSFFIHSSADGHLSCLHVLAIVNSAAMNIGIGVSFSLGFPSSGIVESYVRVWASQVALVVKNLPVNAGRHERHRFDPCIRKIPWRWAWQPTPVFLPGKSHGQRSLAGFSPLGHKELDMTETT